MRVGFPDVEERQVWVHIQAREWASGVVDDSGSGGRSGSGIGCSDML